MVACAPGYKGSGDTGSLGTTAQPLPGPPGSHEPLRPAVVPDASRQAQHPSRWRWYSPPGPSLLPSLWKQQQARAATDVGCLLHNKQLCNRNQGTENMNPTLQPEPPAPTLANEDSGTADSTGETWQREPRDMSCTNQDSLSQQPAVPRRLCSLLQHALSHYGE